MKKLLATVVVLVAALFIVPRTASAHGGEEHIMGTLKAVNASTLSVESQDGKQVEIGFDEKTKFEKSGASASSKDLQVGEKVVVHAKKKGDALIAQVVRFGKQSKSEHPHSEGGEKPREKEHHDHPSK